MFMSMAVTSFCVQCIVSIHIPETVTKVGGGCGCVNGRPTVSSCFHLTDLFSVMLLFAFTVCVRLSGVFISHYLLLVERVWPSLLWPLVLWRCWLGIRNGIRPIKIWLMRCWRGYLLARGADSLHMVQLSHCHPIMSALAKSRMVYPSGTDSPG